MSESRDGRARPERAIFGVFLSLGILGLLSVACASYVEAGRSAGNQCNFVFQTHAGLLHPAIIRHSRDDVSTLADFPSAGAAVRTALQNQRNSFLM